MTNDDPRAHVPESMRAPDYEGLLHERYEQLMAIHERLEDAVKLAARVQDDWAPMYCLLDDLRKWRDDAKAEYDAF